MLNGFMTGHSPRRRADDMGSDLGHIIVTGCCGPNGRGSSRLAERREHRHAVNTVVMAHPAPASIEPRFPTDRMSAEDAKYLIRDAGPSSQSERATKRTDTYPAMCGAGSCSHPEFMLREHGPAVSPHRQVSARRCWGCLHPGFAVSRA